MPTPARYKLLNSSEDDGVQGRFGDRYESGKDGKYVLLAQCVASGFILKECGLQDIALELDNLPAYRNGTASQRRALFLTEMARLMGAGTALVVPPAQPIVEPAIAVEATSETVTKPVDVARTTDLITADKPEETTAPRLPNLGGLLIDDE